MVGRFLGSTRWGCNHCGWSGPEKGSGNSGSAERQELRTYIYRDRDGVPRFRKVRNLPGREPRFWIDYPDGRDGWESAKARQKKKRKAVDTKILYRLDEMTKAIAEGRPVAVVEGEKDADNLAALGFISTCNAHGASEPGKQPKWTKTHSEQLRGADIVVLNDNDPPGFKHADTTCELSLGLAKRVRRLDLAKHWPDMPAKADVSDWLANGHTGDELRALIEGAPDYAPATPQQEQRGEPASEKSETSPTNGIDDAAELEKLARMSALDYERARKDASQRLGISRLSLLDALVKAKRGELGLDGADDGMQGHAIEFPTPETWPEPVEGAALLDALAAAVEQHVIMPEPERHAVALWVPHTYLLDRMMISPRLGIRSPVKGCGKTTLLDVIGQMVFRPLPAANVSASAIFRVVEGHRPCLLIDEADSFLRDNEELRGILNSGHRRGGSVVRNVGDDHEPRAFSTYGACAIALIGQLPGTLADRSVQIDLTRRKPDEVVTPFRFDKVEHLIELQRKLMRWTHDNAEAIAATEPQMPAGLYNRAADNWRGLCAIATVAGGDWLARAHAAALAGAGADIDEGSRIELLLGDIRDIFGSLDLDRISSAGMIERLVEIVPRPWGEYGRSGKPLSPNKLARLLKPLGITTDNIRDGQTVSKGYYRHRFEDAFKRYLPPEGGSKPLHRYNADGTGTSDLFATATPAPDVAVAKCEKSNNGGLCSGVADGRGGIGEDPPLCTYCGRPGGNRAASFGEVTRRI